MADILCTENGLSQSTDLMPDEIAIDQFSNNVDHGCGLTGQYSIDEKLKTASHQDLEFSSKQVGSLDDCTHSIVCVQEESVETQLSLENSASTNSEQEVDEVTKICTTDEIDGALTDAGRSSPVENVHALPVCQPQDSPDTTEQTEADTERIKPLIGQDAIVEQSDNGKHDNVDGMTEDQISLASHTILGQTEEQSLISTNLSIQEVSEESKVEHVSVAHSVEISETTVDKQLNSIAGETENTIKTDLIDQEIVQRVENSSIQDFNVKDKSDEPTANMDLVSDLVDTQNGCESTISSPGQTVEVITTTNMVEDCSGEDLTICKQGEANIAMETTSEMETIDKDSDQDISAIGQDVSTILDCRESGEHVVVTSSEDVVQSLAKGVVIEQSENDCHGEDSNQVTVETSVDVKSKCVVDSSTSFSISSNVGNDGEKNEKVISAVPIVITAASEDKDAEEEKTDNVVVVTESGETESTTTETVVITTEGAITTVEDATDIEADGDKVVTTTHEVTSDGEEITTTTTTVTMVTDEDGDGGVHTTVTETIVEKVDGEVADNVPSVSVSPPSEPGDCEEVVDDACSTVESDGTTTTTVTKEVDEDGTVVTVTETVVETIEGGSVEPSPHVECVQESSKELEETDSLTATVEGDTTCTKVAREIDESGTVTTSTETVVRNIEMTSAETDSSVEIEDATASGVPSDATALNATPTDAQDDDGCVSVSVTDIVSQKVEDTVADSAPSEEALKTVETYEVNEDGENVATTTTVSKEVDDCGNTVTVTETIVTTVVTGSGEEIKEITDVSADSAEIEESKLAGVETTTDVIKPEVGVCDDVQTTTITSVTTTETSTVQSSGDKPIVEITVDSTCCEPDAPMEVRNDATDNVKATETTIEEAIPFTEGEDQDRVLVQSVVTTTKTTTIETSSDPCEIGVAPSEVVTEEAAPKPDSAEEVGTSCSAEGEEVDKIAVETIITTVKTEVHSHVEEGGKVGSPEEKVVAVNTELVESDKPIVPEITVTVKEDSTGGEDKESNQEKEDEKRARSSSSSSSSSDSGDDKEKSKAAETKEKKEEETKEDVKVKAETKESVTVTEKETGDLTTTTTKTTTIITTEVLKVVEEKKEGEEKKETVSTPAVIEVQVEDEKEELIKEEKGDKPAEKRKGENGKAADNTPKETASLLDKDGQEKPLKEDDECACCVVM